MALDKQRILNELGNVVNQLKSADCGCLDNVFSGTSVSGEPMGCRQRIGSACSRYHGGCCQGHGYRGCSSASADTMKPWMGHCNAPVPFADTYAYLNQNLMQPIVKEVYDDLRSITQDNTAPNTPMANQMGLAPGNVANPMMGAMTNQNQPAMGMPGMNGMFGGMENMGEKIMKMMNMNSSSKNNKSAHGQTNMMNNHQGNPKPNTQYMGQDNNIHGQTNMMSNHQGNPNPNTQYMGQGNNIQNYGQHTPAVQKYNEMFPGIKQGDFDPMALALQMNPANQQKGAYDSMHQSMMNKTQKAIDNFIAVGAEANALKNAEQKQQLLQQNIGGSDHVNQLAPGQQITPSQQQFLEGQQSGPAHHQQVAPIQQQAVPTQQQPLNGQLNQQKVYTAVTGGQPYQAQHQQQIVDPSTGNVMEPPTAYAVSGDDHVAPNTPMTMSKEPILPAHTSKSPTEYNTLGQPIQRIPGHIYNVPTPSLPQTLSPNPFTNSPMGKLAVKSTVSKTSLAGSRPVGRIPSRSQLQQVYRQYKVPQSHSNTQQNLRDPPRRGTASDGDLNTAPIYSIPEQQGLIEKVGGDMVANNEIKEQTGNLPGSKKPAVDGNIDMPQFMKNTRNGLQDMAYTSHPSNTAWSFHGEHVPPRPTLYYRPPRSYHAPRGHRAPRRMRY